MGGNEVDLEATRDPRQERTPSTDHVRPQRGRPQRPELSDSSSVPPVIAASDDPLVLQGRPHQYSAHYKTHPDIPTIPHFSNMTNLKKYTRFRWSEKKMICSVVSAHLWFGCIIGIFIPFFPTEASVRGISQSLISGVFAVYALTVFVTSPIVSKLIPLVGATRMFHIGLSVAGVTTVAFGLLDRIPSAIGFITSCYVMRIVEAIGTAAFYTASYTIVANRFPDNMNLLVGTASTMCAIGIAAGPAVGGALYAVGGYGLSFYVLGGVILLMTCFSCAVMPYVGGDQHRVQVLAMTLVAGRSSEFWLNVLSTTAISGIWTGLDPEIAPYLYSALSVDAATLGLYYLLASGIYAIIGPVWGKLCDDLDNNYIQMTICLILAGLGYTFICPEPLMHIASSKALVVLGLTMRELFMGGAFIPTFGNTLRACEEAGLEKDMATQAYASGIMSSAFSIGNAIGAMVAGFSTDQYGFPITVSAFTIAAFILAVVVGAQCVRRWRILRDRNSADQNADETMPLLKSPKNSETRTS